MTALFLRWSWRDLRARWLQVAAIALIIALGVGTYAGLTSTGAWRRSSYDASYRRLAAFDVRASMPSGTYVGADRLAAAGRELVDDGVAAAASIQLEGSIQVDASRAGRTVLVPGRIVGVDVAGGPAVNRLDVTQGRGLRAGETDRVLLDEHFARRRGVAPGSRIVLSGGRSVTVAGRALSPEHFFVLNDRGMFLSDADYALVYASLDAAGALLGKPGAANVLAVRAAPGIPRARLRSAVRATLDRAVPDAAVTIEDRAHDRSVRLLYDDIEGDQRLYDIFALLILLGAAFAAFNLTARIVEAQRRELGVGMALGVPASTLAVRPLLLGVQIAAIGTAFGLVVGYAIGLIMVGYLQSLLPLPVWNHGFQAGVFGRAAMLGVLLPVVATVIPVGRAVRMAPVDAIRTGPRVSRRRARTRPRRAGRRARGLRVLPFRNVFRSPRRTVLTALGIGAAIAVLLGVMGMLDSFEATIARARGELVSSAPRRLTVGLSSFAPVDAAAVVAARNDPRVRDAAVELQIPARVRHGSTAFDLYLIVGDLDGRLWRPEVDDRLRRPGVVLTRKAIDDLGIGVGDRVRLRYPRREGLGYRFVTRSVRVVGASPFPLRSVAWMDDRDGLDRTNLHGITNVVIVDPTRGASTAALQRSLFFTPGIASVQPITELTDTVRKELDRALGFLVVVEGVVLLLALLIAFNTASINADDRAREHATMFAFGLPVRSVMSMDVAESCLVGLLGTGVGLVAGWLLLDWLVTGLLPGTMPDLGVVVAVALPTVLLALVMGVVAVAFAPVLTIRKLLRMDIPSTLRVVE